MLTRIDVLFTDTAFIPEITQSVEQGLYFEVNGSPAIVPPEYNGKQFAAQDFFTFFINHSSELVLGVFGNYLYDLLKNGRATQVRINNKPVSKDKEQIQQSLEDAKPSNRKSNI